jgi:hypothetical protein
MMHYPYAAFHKYYARDGMPSAVEVLSEHFRYGFVLSTPSCFALVHIVHHDAPSVSVGDWDASGDCWHVEFLAGDIADALRHLPHPLPYISFERGDHCVRVFSLSAFAEKFTNQPTVNHQPTN